MRAFEFLIEVTDSEDLRDSPDLENLKSISMNDWVNLLTDSSDTDSIKTDDAYWDSDDNQESIKQQKSWL